MSKLLKMGWKEWIVQICLDAFGKDRPDSMVDDIINGRSFLKNPISDPDVQEMLKKIQSRVCKEKILLDMIIGTKEYYSEKQFLKFLTTIDKALAKKDRIASKFMAKSRVSYESSDQELAVHLSNLAILFSPPDSNARPGLFAGRAQYLYGLGEYEQVVYDAEEALINSKDLPVETTANLLYMRDDCLEICKAQKMDPETEKRRTYCQEILFKIHGERHPNIPSAGNYISVVNHKIKGRVVITTQDLLAGTTIIVEDPYVSVLTASLQWELKYCGYCYKKTRGMFSCQDCVYGTYCSEDCKVADYNLIHKYECPCLNYFHAARVPSATQLGFRAVCVSGPDQMFKDFQEIYTDKKTVVNADQIKGFNSENGRYESNSYLQISNLMHHVNREFLDHLTFYAFHLAKLLQVKTTFFDDIDDKDKENFCEYIAVRLLQHSMSFPINNMSIWESEKTESMKSVGAEKIDTKSGHLENRIMHEGAGLLGIFSLGSLLSHACEPSASRVHLRNGKLAVVIRRSLKAGEEITISYDYKYFIDKLEDRSALLSLEYRIKCKCIACERKWPTLDGMSSRHEFLCPCCSDRFSYEDTVKFQKCVLTQVISSSTFGDCENCRSHYYMCDLEKEFIKHNQLLLKAKLLLSAQNPVDAVPIILNCIAYFQSRILSPSLPLINAQSLLENAYHLITSDSEE